MKEGICLFVFVVVVVVVCLFFNRNGSEGEVYFLSR